MIEKIFYLVAVTLALFIGIGLLLPREANVVRRIEINRPAATVFMLVNGFESYPSWAPLTVRDPGVRYRISGPVAGVGARLDWEGDARLVGKGWQEITYIEPGRQVRMRMELEQQGAGESWFLVERVARGCRLTWGFETDLVEGHGFFGGILARYFGLFFDRWIGADHELGLARLKQFAESLPVTDFNGLEIDIVQAEPVDVLYISVDSEPGADDIGGNLARAYRKIGAFMAEHGITVSGQPMAITRSWDEEGYRFDAAIPVEKNDTEAEGAVRWGQSPSGKAVRLVHIGTYDLMGPSYEKLAAYMAVHGLKEGRVSWEHYISNPGETPVEEVVTHIYFLVDETAAQD